MIKEEHVVYVALGSNKSDRVMMLQSALQEISQIAGVFGVASSNFYETAPKSAIPQGNYLNAVCAFTTTQDAQSLFQELERIEKMLGKHPKPKDAPRVIDLDLLFFGREKQRFPSLEIPHPRWRERLFVLIPLLDLVEELFVPGFQYVNLKEIVNRFPEQEKESVAYHSKPLERARVL